MPQILSAFKFKMPFLQKAHHEQHFLLVDKISELALSELAGFVRHGEVLIFGKDA